MKVLKRYLSSIAIACTLAFVTPVHADVINFNFGVNNQTANPLNFSFSITIPTGLAGLVSYSGTLGATLSDPTGGAVSVSPVGGFLMQGLIDGIGVDNDSVGPITSGFGPLAVFSGTFDCGAACVSLTALVNFTISAGDFVGFSGAFEVVPATVPEPGTLVLLGIGLAGLAFARKRYLHPQRMNFATALARTLAQTRAR
jgi:hypothetical protein